MSKILVEIRGLISFIKVQLEPAGLFFITVYVAIYVPEKILYSVLNYLVLQLNCYQMVTLLTPGSRFPYPMHLIVDAILQATCLLPN